MCTLQPLKSLIRTPRVSKLDTSFLSQPPHSALLTRRTLRVDLATTKKKLQAAQEALSKTEGGDSGSCEGAGEVITNGALNDDDRLRSLPTSQEAQSLRLC